MRRIALVVAVVGALVLIPLAVYALVSPSSGRESFSPPPSISNSWSPEHPGDTPPGGISRDEAIRRAAEAAHPGAGQDVEARAELSGATWVWEVDFEDYGGPTGSSGTQVRLDFFTGQVLDVQQWIS